MTNCIPSAALRTGAIVLVLLMDAALARGQPVATAETVRDFMIQNVCLDEAGAVRTGRGPIDGMEGCPRQRDLRPGEHLPYHKHDHPSPDQRARRTTSVTSGTIISGRDRGSGSLSSIRSISAPAVAASAPSTAAATAAMSLIMSPQTRSRSARPRTAAAFSPSGSANVAATSGRRH